MIYSIVKKVKSFIKEKINFVSQSKIYKLIIEKIDYIQVKYFHQPYFPDGSARVCENLYERRSPLGTEREGRLIYDMGQSGTPVPTFWGKPSKKEPFIGSFF